MTVSLDDILRALAANELTLNEACARIAAASKANPDGTQLWPMLIEARVTQQQLSSVTGRALIDALQQFEPDKTMWLASGTTERPSAQGAVLRTPANKVHQAERVTEPTIESAEQLRAFLWDSPKSEAPKTISIEDVAPLAPPPRAMPNAMPVLPPLEVGAVLKDRYRLQSPLGFGGIGQVFLAVDMEAERRGVRDPRVTLKVVAVDLKKEPQAAMAMKIAVAKSKALEHPNIVKTFGVETDHERLFITMEPLFGRWLGERLRAVRNIGIAQELAWPIIEGIANGLAHAHRHGIVHSDLSPYAVFLAEDGTPKIMGFGWIHALPTSNEALDLLDTLTLRAYSEAYTANLWATHATPQPADDLYPLGVIAYELLSGTHPFERHSLTTARQRNLVFPPIPGLKRRAAKLIAQCLSFERKQRPLDATRFLARLNGANWMRAMFGERFSATTP